MRPAIKISNHKVGSQPMMKRVVSDKSSSPLNRATNAMPDTAAVVTGSFNWNERAAKYNYENIVYIWSRKIADAYWQEFERVKGRICGNAGLISDGEITAAFNKDIITLLTQRIDAAKTSILVAVWSVSVASKKYPNPVYEALMAAQARGVNVRIITDARKAKNGTTVL